MLRTALTPRFLGLGVVVLAVIIAFLFLARWQWGVSHNTAQMEHLSATLRQPVVPLQELVQPMQPFDDNHSLRRVKVSGSYVPSKTVLVANRRLHGISGFWVVTPLQVDPQQGAALLPVVRGFLPGKTRADIGELPKVPAGKVQVMGALAPGESRNRFLGAPADVVGSIDMGLLLNRWNESVFSSFIFLMESTPAENSADLQAVPPPVPTETTIEWRNLFYSLQWVFFAFFAAYVWWRQVRDAYEWELVQSSSAAKGAP